MKIIRDAYLSVFNLTVFSVGWAVVRPQGKRPGLLRPRCLIAWAWIPPDNIYASDSCISPRRHGRITHQPQDVPFGGFGLDLPCKPPLSHGSEGTRWFRALHKWECSTVQGEALRDLVPQRRLCGPPMSRITLYSSTLLAPRLRPRITQAER